MKSKLIFLSYLIFCSHLSLAQIEEIEPINCGSETTHQQSLLEDDNYRLEQEKFQQEYKKAILNGTAQSLNGTIYTLPVVVHLVHGGEPLGTGANLTEDHVKNVLQQSTDRFRHTSGLTFDNSFSGVDTEIEFCLATTDPDGNYSTGVLRYYRPDLNIGTYNQLTTLVQETRWDPTLYYNMYVMTDMTNASGVYFQNVTAYQGGSTFWSGLIAHETGHYLSLAHTFSGGCNNGDCLSDGDGVCDTPPKTTSGFTGDPCASPGNECSADDDDLSANNPYRPVANGGLGDVNDMLENYMDYTGSCWAAFTQGQSARMRLFLQNNRLSVANNATIACAPRTVPANEAGVTEVKLNQSDICDNQFAPTVTVKNFGSATLTSVSVRFLNTENNNALIEDFTLNLAPDGQIELTLTDSIVVNAGTTTIIASTMNPNGATDGFTANDATYISATYLGSTDCATLNNCANFNAATANGPENTTLVNFSGSLPTLSAGLEAYVCVTTNGDVGAGFEAFNILDEDGNSKGLTNSSGVDCSGASPPACFTITDSEYANWSADGTITFTLNPVNTQINPVLCDTNIACVELTIPQGEATTPTNPSGFAGHWQHEDPNTQSIPVTIVQEANNQIFVHSFGKCTPTYCDWGEQSTTTADAQDGQIIVEWDQGFVIRHDTITLINATTIRRNMRSTYTDNSGRADQYSTFLMYKNDCVNHLDLYHVTGDTMTYWSANELTSNGAIQTGQNITFKGGQSITLNSGFHGKAGSFFTAKIEACQVADCTDSLAHNYNANAVTDNGSCMTCFDRIQNGDEEGVDCGGMRCISCADICPDVLMSEFEVTSIANTIAYNYTIKNIGSESANLNGPTDINSDNLSLQNWLSVDSVYGNNDDRAAAGSIIGVGNNLPILQPNETYLGNYQANYYSGYNYLFVIVDWGDAIENECDEVNNVYRHTLAGSRASSQSRNSTTFDNVTLHISPNPFYAQTAIQYQFPTATSVSMHLYDLNGKLVKTIFNHKAHDSGEHQYILDANGLNDGMYFLELQSRQAHLVQKIMLVK